MVGLSAAELQAETLFPGDTIEYFSMAFVAGDKRGHRVSKVLRIDRRDEDFPIRVDTQEMLPLTILIKRNRDRNDFEISSDDAKWRKLRTFKLVDGEVEGETRADRLNAELKQAFSDAMKATKKRLESEKAEKANAGSKKLMNSFFTKAAPSDQEETTDSWRSSEKTASPDRRPVKRKPLTPRENRDSPRKARPHDKVVLKKCRDSEKVLLLDKRPQSESNQKHLSLKRKRSDVTPTKSKRMDPVRQKSQKSISKYFSGATGDQRRPKKKTDLIKFVSHLEEKKLDKNTDLDEYLKLDAKQFEVIEEAGGSGGSGDKSKTAKKTKWNKQREDFRKATGNQMELWLNGSKKRRNELEGANAGSPDASRLQKHTKNGKQRTLNLAPDKAKSLKVHRRDLNFMMSDDSSDTEPRAKKLKHNKYRGTQTGTHYHKIRSSLGSLSAKSFSKGSAKQEQLSFMNRWNHRK